MTILKTLDEIKFAVDELAAKIGAPARERPTYGWSRGDGLPRIEIGDSQYHFVVEEYGREQFRVSSDNVDEILYHVFGGITYDMAMDYEMQYRVPGKDHRRLRFQRQIELLSQISPDWPTRIQDHHRELVLEYPFRDA